MSRKFYRPNIFKLFSHNSMHKYSIVALWEEEHAFSKRVSTISWPHHSNSTRTIETELRDEWMSRSPGHISKLWEQVQRAEWELLGEKSPGHRVDKWQSAYTALHIYIPLIRFPQCFSMARLFFSRRQTQQISCSMKCLVSDLFILLAIELDQPIAQINTW